MDDTAVTAAAMSDLLKQLVALRDDVAAEAPAVLQQFAGDPGDPALMNLAHYLSVRRRDLRDLQRALMWRGLSSLGRLESRVLPTLDATIAALSALVHSPEPVSPPDEATFFAGEARLHRRAERLLGTPGGDRATRIMATLPTEAADNPELVDAYARAGMDVARINCAHDSRDAWRAMARNVRDSARKLGRGIRVLMDIAGPKIRTGTVVTPNRRMVAGDLLHLAAVDPIATVEPRFEAGVVPPEIVSRLATGERVLYNDGKLEAVVETTAEGTATLRVTRTRAGGVRLKPEKGLNLPGTPLGLSPLTGKDEQDIATLIECADLIGYSFISRSEDIDILENLLAGHDGKPTLGLVAKIERPEAIQNLPELIARAAGHRPFGVMIARGDLAVEIGFERLAEMQEEILWICEAASVPAIWATQVLDGIVSDGIPTRGEMTDAAMGVRAECVMLNKGPHLLQAIEVLDRLLGRMDDHMSKKTAMLRALRSW